MERRNLLLICALAMLLLSGCDAYLKFEMMRYSIYLILVAIGFVVLMILALFNSGK
ncbi:hypothetical protein Pedsa_0551 [Pseudopedobacter saltans DSM 12145]|uniref:Uncharacterized protein n=1 Tax=Pseudopedobacter saltans (strain ATCC 51119 / DSM 12145 / JCM 21818 / CCUG 39354 / LMG 10337 / NBRC 100064 / NCIMB 13643) TaxID=762903 RepID=F0S7A5_PSESL|nr:hypothetical protein Pedsa_0551 [Pseudopedobacter saltans DSM 12145]